MIQVCTLYASRDNSISKVVDVVNEIFRIWIIKALVAPEHGHSFHSLNQMSAILVEAVPEYLEKLVEHESFQLRYCPRLKILYGFFSREMNVIGVGKFR